MWWAAHQLQYGLKNDGDFRWFLLLWCNWHLKSSCIKESETNIIELINICSLNAIQSNVFCNENMKLRKAHKERNVRHLAIYELVFNYVSNEILSRFDFWLEPCKYYVSMFLTVFRHPPTLSANISIWPHPPTVVQFVHLHTTLLQWGSNPCLCHFVHFLNFISKRLKES